MYNQKMKRRSMLLFLGITIGLIGFNLALIIYLQTNIVKLSDSLYYDVFQNANSVWLYVNGLIWLLLMLCIAIMIRRFINVQRQHQEKETLDVLTTMPNRAHFIELLSQMISECRYKKEEIAVVFMNCDRFKLINDRLGHRAGDQFLQQLSAQLKEMVAPYGHVFRIGGDEFAVLLHSSSIKQNALDQVLDKLTRLFQNSWYIAGQRLFATASIGAAIYPEHGNTTETIMKAVDLALYHAKKNGGNQIVIYKEAHLKSATRRSILDNDLYTAFEGNELEVVYQPQVHLMNGEVIGMEALLRWTHPQFGPIPPLEFISLAEESELIIPLGKWVLMEVCRQNKLWVEEGHQFVVSVNISTKQLKYAYFVEDVQEVLQSTGLAPHYLQLEITEGLLLEHNHETLNNLSRLKQLGIEIAMDDFGTGYSSLAYINKYPIDTIKIDKSFIQDLPNNYGNLSIVRAIIELCHDLSIDVVAEGTETREQIESLRLLGCDVVQGYYFGKPVKVDQWFDQMKETESRIAGFLKYNAVIAEGELV